MTEKKSTGDYSTGDYSTGYYSTGDYSTGYYSTGYYSTGDYSTGDYSTGCRSTGDYSTGDYSAGDYSTGDFCTEIGEKRMFNKPVSNDEYESRYLPDFLRFSPTKWIKEGNITDEQKANDPEFHIKKDTLVTVGYKQAFKDSWDNADKEDRVRIKELPNFDADIFFEISGIDVNEEDKPVTLEERVKKIEKKLQEIKDVQTIN